MHNETQNAQTDKDYFLQRLCLKNGRETIIKKDHNSLTAIVKKLLYATPFLPTKYALMASEVQFEVHLQKGTEL